MSTKITKFLEENLPCEGYITIYLDPNDKQIKVLTNVVDKNQLARVMESAIRELILIHKALTVTPLAVLLIDKTHSDIDNN